MRNNIGIITWHYYPNFGSALQAYALQHTIENLGHEVSIINYHNPKFGEVNQKRNQLKVLLGNTIGKLPIKRAKRFSFASLVFSSKYHHCGSPTTDSRQLAKLASNYDVIVCGSDQIWAPNVYNPIYFASFAKESIRKISYAASIGLNDIPEELVPKYKEHLSDFYAIGIREQEGKDLLKKKCGIESTVVLDPTLLVDVDTYKGMQREVKGIKQPYLFCYFLNKEHQYKDRVQQYAKENNLTIVGVSDNAQDAEWMTRLTGLGADHFLWLINHAETVMTDSYHGSIYSLLFHKNLWIFQRFAEDNPICQNSRIRQLSNYFYLDNRIISANSTIDDSQPIDFNTFEARLKELKDSSISFLKQALQ